MLMRCRPTRLPLHPQLHHPEQQRAQDAHGRDLHVQRGGAEEVRLEARVVVVVMMMMMMVTLWRWWWS
jgi:hypothetical protein